MAITPQGQFIPQQMQQAPQMSQQVMQAPTPFNGQQVPMQQQPQFQAQQAMQQARPNYINQQALQFNPQLNMQQRFMPQVVAGGTPQQPAPQPAPQQQPSQFAPPPWAQQGQGQQQGGPPPWMQGQGQGQLGMQQGWGGQNYGVAQGQQVQQGQSIEQGVQNNNPQSVQNFMSALHQVGAGSSNGMMNGNGQQGAQAQAGFQGFGSNGYQGPISQGAQAGPVQYGGAGNGPGSYNGQVQNGQVNGQFSYGSAGNSGYAGGQYNQMQLGTMPGDYGQQMANGAQGGFTLGQGTAPGQAPAWQTPGPWGQPGNAAPGTPGSNYSNDENGWNNYLGAGGTQTPVSQVQGGAFYSPVVPGNNSQPSPGGSITPEGGYLDANGNSGTSNGSGPVAVSDLNAKTNIKTGDAELKEFLDALGVYSYEYKDPANGDGRRISPMAQEIESTPLGKAAISTNAQGYKQVDYGKLAGTQLAALALLNHKYNLLEQKLKKNIATNLKNRKK